MTAMPTLTMPPRAPAARRLPSTVLVLLVGSLIIRAAAFAYPLMSFRLSSLGYSAQITGLVVATFGIGWAGGQLLSGWASDRLGPRNTIVTAMLLCAGALGVLALSRSLPAILVSSALAGLANDAPRPAVGAVIADLVAQDARRARINGWRHFTNNAGTAVAGCVGGLLAIRLGWSALFFIEALACTVFAGMVLASMRMPRQRPASRSTGSGYREALADRRLWLLAVASVAGGICALGIVSVLPMLLSSSGVSVSAFGWIEAANGVTVVVLTPLMNPWLGRRATGSRPMVGVVAASVLLLGVAMGVASVAGSPMGTGLAVVASVPGEIAFMVAANDVVNRIAPEAARGRYNGVWCMTIALAAVVAPMLSSFALTHGGRNTMALTMLVVGLAGAACCGPLARSIQRRGVVRAV